MNILRTIFSVLVFATLGIDAVSASSPASKASLLWLQGQAVDDAYAQAQAPSRDIRVQVWHDRDDDDPYRRGENLQVNFRTNADMYVTLYRLDVDGFVEILWPTSRFDDGFVYGNHTYTLPRPGSPVRLTVSDRKGVEYVQAIASEYPFDLRQLGIDFRFDLDEERVHDYRVSGDPFLAVNDINFAITGLEEDVDYVVTDWTHLYVESKVDYARYSCTQCHQGDSGETYVHPYVDTCKTVTVYTDWSWHRSWYVSFGWYPLYYDPPYYYWDAVYARPYWFSYYPIYYSWYWYPVYQRPYPLYRWHDSPWYAGDYRVRYRKGVVRTAPLYDVASPGTRVRLRNDDARGGSDVVPPSVARASRTGTAEGRVDADRLVRTGVPSRERAELAPRAGSTTRPREVGVRDDRARSTQRRVTSLAPEGRDREERTMDRPGVGDQRDRSSERRWTRPVIRSGETERGSPQRDSARDRGGAVDRSRSNDRERGQVDVPRRDERTRDRENVDRPRTTTPRRERSESTPRVAPQRERQQSEPRVTPQRERQRSEPRVTPQRERQQSEPRVTPQREQRREPQKVQPAPKRETQRQGQVSPPRSPSRSSEGARVAPQPARGSNSGAAKAAPSRGSSGSSSNSRGSSSESRSRGGGGGRG